MKTKLIMVIPNLMGGGAEKQFILNYENIDKGRFDVQVCLFNSEGPFLPLLGNVSTINLHKESRFDYLKLVKGLSKAIQVFQPDVIYSRLQYANIISSLALNRLSMRKDIVHIMNEETILSMGLSGSVLGSIVKLMVKNTYPRATKIIAPCQASKNDLIHNFDIPENKITVIYNSIDVAAVKQRATVNDFISPSVDTPVVITVGSLRKEKGHIYLINAMRKICEYTPCKLWILGDGEEKSNLERKTSELGMQDHITFMGFQDNPYKFMAKAAVFALPSVREGLPTVILEAMALGLPVVASDVGGTSEIIKNAVNGFIIPPGNVSQLAEKIVGLIIKNNHSKSGVIKKEEIYVEDKFDIHHNVKLLESLFTGDVQ